MSTRRSRPIADRYDVLGQIGEGGAAIVYRARDLRLDRIVALKVLREAFGGDHEFQRRFQREARTAASLNHPNIVDVYDYGQAGPTYYIAMEYLEGGNLKDRIRRMGRLPPAEVRDVAQQVLSALGAAHARGLVHRDVKPQNVLLDGAGVAKLTDFGIAHGPDAAETTQVGMTVGTAAYIAPEQATGGVVGPATDIYGVGILLYEMLAGRPPFEGGTPFEVAYRQVNEPVPRPSSLAPGVPPDLEAIALKALAKDPLDRFASAGTMSDALSSGFALDADATQPMRTVRMPRVAPPRAAARPAPTQGVPASGYPAPGTRPVVVAAPPRRGRGATALIVTLGVLGGLALLALLLSLIAQELGLFGGAPRTPLPGPSATVQPTFAAPAKAVAAAPTVTPTPTRTASPTPTSSPTSTPTPTMTQAATATAAPTNTAAPTSTPVPTNTPPPTPPTPPPTNTPPPPPTNAPTGPPTLTPTPPPPKPAAPTPTPTTPPKPAAPTPTPVPPKPGSPTVPPKP